jgi:hypothetical protein
MSVDRLRHFESIGLTERNHVQRVKPQMRLNAGSS